MKRPINNTVKLFIILAVIASVVLAADIFILIRSSDRGPATQIQSENAGQAVSCKHVFKDGVCTLCGYICPHSHFTAGVCDECGYVCPHENHDSFTQACTLCGERVLHRFADRKCAVCGAQLDFNTTTLPMEIWADCAEPGTVQYVEYQTSNYYMPDREQYTKRMTVYLPYGYTENIKYDVVFLLHGYGGTEDYWLVDGQSYKYPETGYTEWASIKNMIDNMVQWKLCKPVIVVCPTYYLTEEQRQGGDKTAREVAQFTEELRKDIMPCIASQFSTYARNGSPAELRNARDHFGFVGASFGSILSYNAVMANNFDLFAWYGNISGFNTGTGYLRDKLNSQKYSGLGINYLYISAGDNDNMRADTYLGYKFFRDSINQVSSEKLAYIEVENTVHECRVWDNGVFNCLRVFFTEFSNAENPYIKGSPAKQTELFRKGCIK